MKTIVCSELYNVLKDDETISLNFNSLVTILTGYNGIGKSTVLGVIHALACELSENEYQFTRYGWAHRAFFNDEQVVEHIVLPYNTDSDLADELDIEHDLNDDVALTYSKLLNAVTERIRQQPNSFRHQTKARLYQADSYLRIATKINETEYDEKVGFSSIHYRDEVFYFSNSEGLSEDSERLKELDVYSKSVNLDKTLYLLIKDFSARSISNGSGKSISEIIDEVKSAVLDRGSKASIDLAIRKLELLKQQSVIREYREFFDQVNLFFNKTHREIVQDVDGLLAVRLNKSKKIIKWFDLSKGEKTLLSLLLVTYLNRDSGCVFLFDEPDLSLHIGWQKILLPSLVSLAPKSQFIISTHSPAMVGNLDAEKVINLGKMKR